GNEKGIKADFSYNTTTNEIPYKLPNISQSTEYLFSITGNLISKNNKSNTATSTEKIVVNDGVVNGNNVSITENKAATISKEGETERLSYTFKTSKYKTFSSKLNAIDTQNYNFGVLYSDVIYLSNTIASDEAFDMTEL